MVEDGVVFDGVFKFYEICLVLKVGDLKKVERFYIVVKKENVKIVFFLDGEFFLFEWILFFIFFKFYVENILYFWILCGVVRSLVLV